jgi:hypothetical protein
MAQDDLDERKRALLQTLEGEAMEGIRLEELRRAMSHPKAAETIRELLPYEAGAPGPGAPAPDFALAWLPGSEPPGGAPFRLSDHFGRRPVALIFGSYT